MKNIFPSMIFLFAILLIQSCTTYSSSLNKLEKLEDVKVEDIRKGMACTNNLFGGFKLPWIGDTAIRINGNQSVMSAIKKANLKHIYAIDFSTEHYVFYSKKCTVVFGQ